MGGTFWSVYVGCPANGSDFSGDNYATSTAPTTTLTTMHLMI